MTELDYKDGYVHLSTAQQVPKTLARFYADTPAVTILRLETARVSAFKRVVWEKTSSGDSKSKCGSMFTPAFPHLYAHLEGENIDSFREIENGPKGWDGALQSIQDWLV